MRLLSNCILALTLLCATASLENSVPRITNTFVLCDDTIEPKRCAFQRHQLNRNHIPFGFFTYIWKSQLTDSVLEKFHMPLTRDLGPSPGDASLIINHVFLAQHIRKNYQAGTFLVFESDAILGSNFSHWLNKFLTEWQEKDLQVDVVFLGECMGNVVASPQDGTFLYRATKARCSESLVWSYDGIVRFVDYYEKRARSEVPKQDPLFTEPIDFVLENFHNGIEQPGLFWTFPSIVKQGSQHGMFASHLRDNNAHSLPADVNGD